MTSGVFKQFPVDQIWVDREKRQRREITEPELVSLGESIKAIGLINPITVKRSGELIAGERRWSAVKRLGWTDVSVQFAEDLAEDELHLIELEENTKRQDLTWQDNCLAVENYHKLRAKLDPSWTQTKTAEALNLSPKEVSAKRYVAQEIEGGNKKVAEAPRYSVARGITERSREREKASSIEAVKIVESDGEIPFKKAAPLLNTDFIEWSKSYEGTKFNFIHCDFPYGISADAHDQGAASSLGGYADTMDTYETLLARLDDAMDNVVAESAHLMFWFSMRHYDFTKTRLQEMGWNVNYMPLVWHKSDNIGMLPDPQRGPRQIYETCLIASRGDRKIVRSVSNVVSSPTTKEIHMSEKPVPMLRKFMEMFVDKSTVMLDPTCGSGNSVRAALALGAPQALGLEINTEFYDLAIATFKDVEL